MPNDIQFPEVEPRYVFERDCLGFRARLGDRPIECLVTLELLMSRFGVREPSEQAMRQAFAEHRQEIQALAHVHIQNGWIDRENRVFLTTRYTRLNVHIEESLAKNSQVAAAQRMLIGIIGPQAGELIVEWHTSPEIPPNPTILIRIKDPALRREVSAIFPQKAWADSAALHGHLTLLWSALLSARSQELVLKSG